MNSPAPLFPGINSEPVPFSGNMPAPTLSGKSSDAAHSIAAFDLANAPPLPMADEKSASNSQLEIVDMAGPSQPKSGKGGMVVALLVLGLGAAGFLAFNAGVIPGFMPPGKTPASSVPQATAAAPEEAAVALTTPSTTLPAQTTTASAEITPQAPSPEAQLEELKRQAIDIVQAWPTSDKAFVVGQRLESKSPSEGGLSPWMAEKLTDDVFQVNFYAPKSAAGKQTVFEFEAHLADKNVVPLNAAAKALLIGRPAKIGKRAKLGKRPRLAKLGKIRIKGKKNRPAKAGAAPVYSPAVEDHLPGMSPEALADQAAIEQRQPTAVKKTPRAAAKSRTARKRAKKMAPKTARQPTPRQDTQPKLPGHSASAESAFPPDPYNSETPTPAPEYPGFPETEAAATPAPAEEQSAAEPALADSGSELPPPVESQETSMLPPPKPAPPQPTPKKSEQKSAADDAKLLDELLQP